MLKIKSLQFCAFYFLCLVASTAFSQTTTIQEITCSGNSNWSCDFLAKYYFQEPGEIVDDQEIENAQIRLAHDIRIKSADVQKIPGASAETSIIKIIVTENEPIFTGIGAQWVDSNGRSFQNLNANIIHTNLFGTGKVLGASYGQQFARSPLGPRSLGSSIWLFDPHLFGDRKTFSNISLNASSYFYDQSDSPNSSNTKNENDSKVLWYSMGRRFAKASYFEAHIGKYLYSNARKSYDRTTTSFGSTLTEHKQDEYTYETSFGFSYGFSTENDSFFPTSGSRLWINSIWSTAKKGDFDYSLDLGYRTFYSFSADYTLGLSLGSIDSASYFTNDPRAIGLSLSKKLSAGGLGFIERGHWYIEPQIAQLKNSGASGKLKSGFLFTTKTLGLFDLSLMWKNEI
jgi:outer membrane protein assembly factor BamA